MERDPTISQPEIPQSPPPPPPVKRIALFRSSIRDDFRCALGLLGLLLIFRLKAFKEIAQYYLGSVDGDGGLYAWLASTNPTDLISLGWFEKSFFYPYGNTLAWSDNFILPSYLSYFFSLLGCNDTLAFNLVILLANFLNGFITYKLLQRLAGEVKIAFSSGAAFMTSSYLTHQLGHPQLQFAFFIPLLLLLFFYFLKDPTFLRSLAIGVALTASFLTTIYYTYFSFLLCMVFLAGLFCLRPKALSRTDLLKFFAGIACGIIPLLPFALPYLMVRDAFGGRGIYEAYYFAASLWSYISASPDNLLYQVTAPLSDSEAHLFPGLVLTAFSVAAVARLAQATRLKKLFYRWVGSFAIFIAFYSMSSGPIFRIGCSISSWLVIATLVHLMIELGRMEVRLGFEMLTGRSLIALLLLSATVFFIVSLGPLANPEKGQFALTPYWVFYKIVPGFDSIRAICRSGILVYFSIALLFGFALSRLTIRPEWQRSVFLPLAFVLVENYNSEYPLSAPLPTPVVVSDLASIKSPGAVMLLPYAGTLDDNNEVSSWSEFARINVSAMLWLKNLGRPYVNGYSGQKTKLMRELPRELREFPSPRSIRALSKIAGLRYLVFHSQFAKAHDPASFLERIKSVSPSIKLISSGSDGSYLFELATEETIDDQFEIIVPPSYEKVLFEVRSLFNLNTDLTKVRVVNRDDPALSLIETISIKGDGGWNGFVVTLPKNRNRVRPIRLAFRSESNEAPAIRIRNIRLQSQ